jgi:hypothetical protein
MVLFKILWCIDALTSIVVLYYFFVGLADGTVSSFNMGLWFLILAALAVSMLGSIWLRSHQHPALAIALLCLLAIPAFLYGLFILLLIFGNTRWN